MFDWNHNGKIDAGDHAFTAFLLDEMDSDDGDDNKPTGCCGPTVAMFLMGIIFPVILTVVFVAH